MAQQILKVDLKKKMKEFYLPSVGAVQVVRVPKMKFIMIDGKGEPGGEGFQQAIQAMYGTAYTLKFKVKKEQGKDYPVMPLEGLWWMKGGGFDPKRRQDWEWTLMIMTPDFVTGAVFESAREELRRKKNPAALDRVRMEEFEEGDCVQAMHVGPYSEEARTIDMLEKFAKDNGYRMVGKHHEVYMGDPRRAAPSKLKTVVRHPVER